MEDIAIIEGKKRAEELCRENFIPGNSNEDDPFIMDKYISTFVPRYFPNRPGRKPTHERTYEEIKELLKSLK